MAYKSINHAEHNKSVCDHLIENTEFHDWVITTAFYAAIHFLRHYLFPLEEGGKTFNTFDDYCGSNKIYRNKHSQMRKLVEEHAHHTIASTYNQMLDICWSARYSQYKFSAEIAGLARRRLNHIENNCK